MCGSQEVGEMDFFAYLIDFQAAPLTPCPSEYSTFCNQHLIEQQWGYHFYRSMLLNQNPLADDMPKYIY